MSGGLILDSNAIIDFFDGNEAVDARHAQGKPRTCPSSGIWRNSDWVPGNDAAICTRDTHLLGLPLIRTVSF